MRLVRLLVVLGIIVTGMAESLVVRLLVRGRWTRIRRQNLVSRRCARLLLRVIGVTVRTEGREDTAPGNCLIVANHLSYIDLAVMMAARRSCFVTSVEMRETPGLGWVCALVGCLFVENRNWRRLRHEIQEVAAALRDGLDVVVYPEATSGNGDGVLPFHRALFKSAVLAQRTVQVACINYPAVEGADRDDVFWYGEMDFLPHLWRLLGRERVEVVLSWLEVLPPDADTRRLRDTSYERVSARFRPCVNA